MYTTEMTTHHIKAEPITSQVLEEQNLRFQGSGGVSGENSGYGFQPAFCDTRTGAVYLSRFSSGEPAPIHLLDGLPEKLVAKRSESGHVRSAVEMVVAGFVLEDHFFTREQAAATLKGSL